MTDRPRRTKDPLITSTIALRALASAITLTSFGGMTFFASENLHVSNAPLQPTAIAAAAAIPAPTVAPATSTTSTTSRSRTTVGSSISSTPSTAVTRTKQS